MRDKFFIIVLLISLMEVKIINEKINEFTNI